MKKETTTTKVTTATKKGRPSLTKASVPPTKKATVSSEKKVRVAKKVEGAKKQEKCIAPKIEHSYNNECNESTCNKNCRILSALKTAASWLLEKVKKTL